MCTFVYVCTLCCTSANPYDSYVYLSIIGAYIIAVVFLYKLWKLTKFENIDHELMLKRI